MASVRTSEDARRVLQRLTIVRWVAIADAVLLVVLLWGSFTHRETVVSVVGLAHGIVFLLLLAVIAHGALQRLWSWWFLAGTIVTTGPPGAFIGEVLIARRAKAALATE